MTPRVGRGLSLCVVLVATGCGGPAPDPFAKKILEVPRRVRSEDVERHLQRLHGATPGERAAGFSALADLGTEDEALRAAFKAALSDPSEELRYAALRALALRGLAPGATGAPLVASVLEALDAEPIGLRAAARDAIPALGASIVVPLAERLSDSKRRTRWNAAAALERLGSEADAATSALIAAWEREAEADVRERIAGALAGVGPGGVRTLLQAIGGSDAARIGVAASALRTSPAPALAVAAREALAAGAAPGVRDAVAATAAERPDVAALLIPELIGLLADEGPAALDAEDALVAVGEPARGALEALAGTEAGAGSVAARSALERLADE